MFKLIIAPKDAHEDLILICEPNNFKVAADSYFLVLSKEDNYKNYIGYKKVFTVLRDIFFAWLKKVERKEKFLPYAIWDEGIGGFALEYLQDGMLVIRYGFIKDYGLCGEDLETLLSMDLNNVEINEDFTPITTDKQSLKLSINRRLIEVADMFLS